MINGGILRHLLKHPNYKEEGIVNIFTRINGFLPYIFTVFLNAFVDLGH